MEKIVTEKTERHRCRGRIEEKGKRSEMEGSKRREDRKDEEMWDCTA